MKGYCYKCGKVIQEVKSNHAERCVDCRNLSLLLAQVTSLIRQSQNHKITVSINNKLIEVIHLFDEKEKVLVVEGKGK